MLETDTSDENISEVNLPPEILSGINSTIDNENAEKSCETMELSETEMAAADDEFNSDCFEYLNDEESDEIATESNAKNTHNQTKWAVGVFKGK